MRLTNLTSDPAGAAGRMYFNSSTGTIRLHNGSGWVDWPTPSGGAGAPWSFSSNTHFWDFTGTFSARTTTSISDIGYMASGHTMSGVNQSLVGVGSQGKTAVRFGGGDTSQYTSSAYPRTGTGPVTVMASFYNMVNNGVGVQHIMHYGYPTNYRAFGICYGAAYNDGVNWIANRWGNHRWGGNEPNAWDYIAGQGGQTVIFVRYNGGGTSNCRYYRNNSSSPTRNDSQSHANLDITTYDGMRVGARISGTDVERADFDMMGCGAFNNYLPDADCDAIAGWCAANYG